MTSLETNEQLLLTRVSVESKSNIICNYIKIIQTPTYEQIDNIDGS